MGDAQRSGSTRTRDAHRSERPQRAARIPGGRQRDGIGEIAGALRARRITAPWPERATRHLRAARSEWTGSADDKRPAKFLEYDLRGGTQGTARPVSAAPMARRSLDGHGNASGQAARFTLRVRAQPPGAVARCAIAAMR